MSQQSARNTRLGLSLIVMLFVLGACASQPQHTRGGSASAGQPVRSDHSPGSRAAGVAAAQVGVPYRYGGSSPSGFDCSGLVYFSYSAIGRSVPRTTSGLWQSAAPVDKNELQAGDIVFFRIDGKMSHVGMYLDNGRFVHAPASGRRVSVESLYNEFYGQAFIRGGRL